MRDSVKRSLEEVARDCLGKLAYHDLCSVNAGVIPPGLMKRLQKLAYKEIERRRMTQ